MADSCVFCKIIKSEIPCHKIYEDENTISFLDINPIAEGHALVIPKTHATLVEDLNNDNISSIFETTQNISKKLRETLGKPSTTIAIHNGKEAGQEIPHVHVHIIPRDAVDGGGAIHNIMSEPYQTDNEKLQKLADRISI